MLDFSSIYSSFLLVVALSIDAFTASFAYGTEKIKVPFSSTMLISILCSSLLGISMILGCFIRPFIPDSIVHIICALIFLALGIIKLFDSSIKTFINKQVNKNIEFSFCHLNFILNVYADPKTADCDLSKTLSIKESVMLAIALSLDGITVGFGASLIDISVILTVAISFILGVLAIKLGCLFGNIIAKQLSFDLSWISGILMIILAILAY